MPIKESIDKMKVEVRERNALVKQEIKNRLQAATDTVKKSEKKIEDYVGNLTIEMNAEFQRMSSLTEEQQQQLQTFKVDVEDLKNEIYDSVANIGTQVMTVQREV